jgi:glycosyltransferase involved in cell wall biosynthesis
MRVSIVTPSFNQREYLQATLESVLSQGYADLEYVVVDGGSEDGSAEVIEEHADRLAYWVSEPDKGLYDALNKGFSHTSGEVMGWINSSDLHYPWTLQTVSEIFSQLPDVQWIMGMSSQFGPSGGPRSIRAGFYNVYDFLAGDYRWIQQESVFWRRSLWERAGGGLDDSLRRAADFGLWLRFLQLTPLYHVGTILGGWRVHDDHLGELGGGEYTREVEQLMERFVADAPRLLRARARLVRVAGLGRDNDRVVPRTLHKLGAWPWYQHRRVLYDFEAGTWLAR